MSKVIKVKIIETKYTCLYCNLVSIHDTVEKNEYWISGQLDVLEKF